MFEIHKRHNPMFVLSDVKRLAKIMADLLELENFNKSVADVEIVDISQTVRINENNQFIVRSALGVDKVTSVLNESPILKRIRNADNASLVENTLKNMVRTLGIDSYISIGEGAPIPGLEKTLPKAGKNSKKPLIIFNELKELQYQWSDADWEGIDHPALWIGKDWIPAMSATESFFAMSPELKLETALNRYQPLESLGRFSVGLVRF